MSIQKKMFVGMLKAALALAFALSLQLIVLTGFHFSYWQSACVFWPTYIILMLVFRYWLPPYVEPTTRES